MSDHRARTATSFRVGAMEEVILRFLIGGSIVAVFAAIGDVVEPKSFAGIFGAAPSVALATLILTIDSKGKIYAATELRSTIAGALALFAYAAIASHILIKRNLSANLVASVCVALWMVVAIGLWAVSLR